MRVRVKILMLTACMLLSAYGAEHAGRIHMLEGEASILRSNAGKWQQIRLNMPVRIGDQIYTREESFVEIRLINGTIMRLDEKTKIVVDSADETGVRTSSSIGNIWVNMRKLVNTGKEFELSSPTATAAIRGTVFQMQTDRDSSTDVSVYSGKIEVGPTKGNNDSDNEGNKPKDRVEVPGPEEIPGPYEVSLDQWRMIVAGQKISVRGDGKYAQTKFDPEKSSENSFVRRNRELDIRLESEE